MISASESSIAKSDACSSCFLPVTFLRENCKPICIAAAAQQMRCWSRFVTIQSGSAIDEICPARLIARLEQLNFRRGGQAVEGGESALEDEGQVHVSAELNRREIPRLRVPALRAKAKSRDTPLGMTRDLGELRGQPKLSHSRVVSYNASGS